MMIRIPTRKSENAIIFDPCFRSKSAIIPCPGWCGELSPRTVNLPKKKALPPSAPSTFLLLCPLLFLLPQFQSF